MLCLNMVLDTLSVAEEAEALHLIVSHAGERLYDRVPLEDFLASLQTHVAQFDAEGCPGQTKTETAGETRGQGSIGCRVGCPRWPAREGQETCT